MEECLLLVAEKKRTKLISAEKKQDLYKHYGFHSAEETALELFDELLQEKVDEVLLTAMLHADTRGGEVTEESMEPVRKQHRMYLWQHD